MIVFIASLIAGLVAHIEKSPWWLSSIFFVFVGVFGGFLLLSLIGYVIERKSKREQNVAEGSTPLYLKNTETGTIWDWNESMSRQPHMIPYRHVDPARYQAAIELHNAFAPAMVEIKNAPDNTTGENMNIINKIIGHSIKQHAIAVEKFRFFLDGEERIRFDSAWEEYNNGYDDGHGYEYFDLANADMRIGCRRLALERINKILEFGIGEL